MKALQCPHCGQAAMSVWRKMNLGAGRSVTCVSCAAGIGVPWMPYIVLGVAASVVPLLGGLQFVVVLGKHTGHVFAPFMLGAVLSAVPLIALHVGFVPLIARAKARNDRSQLPPVVSQETC